VERKKIKIGGTGNWNKRSREWMEEENEKYENKVNIVFGIADREGEDGRLLRERGDGV